MKDIADFAPKDVMMPMKFVMKNIMVSCVCAH